MGITRGILRWGLIGAVGLGAVAWFVGPERVSAGFDRLRSGVRSATEHWIDDPAALRRQLADLAEQYPHRIAEVRGELASVERQLQQIDHERDVARRVVAMAEEDLETLRPLVESPREHRGRLVSLRSGGAAVSPERALAEAQRIRTVRDSYRDRAVAGNQQTDLLGTQRDRLAEILAKLQQEQTRFEARLWQLDRQIDAIARNERLIELTKQQQAILAEYDRFGRVGNLDQIEGRLAQLRAKQDARLESLSRSSGSSYEQAAEERISQERASRQDPFEGLGKEDPSHSDRADRSVASR
jgi:phage shock protein A